MGTFEVFVFFRQSRFATTIGVYIYDVLGIRMSPSLLTTVSEPNRKMFAVGLHVINELHMRFPELAQENMRIVWFGAALQGQVPVLSGLCPNVEFEVHTRKRCPLSTELQNNVQVTYHNSSLDECLEHIEAYDGPKKLAVLLDLDFHIKPRELSVLNKANIAPTVESESVHYDRYTTKYNAACHRLSVCGHVLLVSTPFRLPWLTGDFNQNAHLATWLDPQLPITHMRCPTMMLSPQFGARLKSTELRALFVTGNGYEESMVDWQSLDSSLHQTATETRELVRAKFMLEQLLTFRAVTDKRKGIFSPEGLCLQAWSDSFISNSIDEVRQLVHNLESTNGVQVIYKDE